MSKIFYPVAGGFQLGTLESCCICFSLRFTYRILQVSARQDEYANRLTRRLYQLIINGMICVVRRTLDGN